MSSASVTTPFWRPSNLKGIAINETTMIVELAPFTLPLKQTAHAYLPEPFSLHP